MGMYGPNDVMGAAGYERNGGCMIVILLFIGAGVLIAL